jgi:hypothetical protein
MKTLFVSLIAFLFALFVGCQSSITDPLADGMEISSVYHIQSDAYKDAISFYPGAIKLEGKLYDPSQLHNDDTDISGIIRYRLDQNDFDSGIKVSLFVKAELKCKNMWNGQPMTINKTSQDIVYRTYSNRSFYYLEKEFDVENVCRVPLILVLSFRLDEKELNLESMNLKKGHRYLPLEDPEK